MAKTVLVKVVRDDGESMEFGTGTDWYIENEGLENWSAPTPEVSYSENVTYDGATVTSKRVASIDRTLEATLRNARRNELMRERVVRFFNPKHGYEAHITYQGRTLWCEGEHYAFKCDTGNVYQPVSFSWTMLCPMPYMLSEDDFGQDIAAIDAKFGFPLQSCLPAGTESVAGPVVDSPSPVCSIESVSGGKLESLEIFGRTRQNLWVNPSGTSNGITVTSDDDGTISISGTATRAANIFVNSYILVPGKAYVFSANKVINTYGASIYQRDSSGGTLSNVDIAGTLDSSLSKVITILENAAYCSFHVNAPSGITASVTDFRVMLREATGEEIAAAQQTASTLQEGGTADLPQDYPVTLPADPGIYAADDDFDWCPPGINGVGELREDEKNLWQNPDSGTKYGVTFTKNDDGSVTVDGKNTSSSTVYFDYGSEFLALKPSTTYTLSIDKSISPNGYFVLRENDSSGDNIVLHQIKDQTESVTFQTHSNMASCIIYIAILAGADASGTYRVMLNEGSAAKPWVALGTETALHLVTTGKNLLDVEVAGMAPGTSNATIVDFGKDVQITAVLSAIFENATSTTSTGAALFNLMKADGTNQYITAYSLGLTQNVEFSGTKSIDISEYTFSKIILYWRSDNFSHWDSDSRITVQLEFGTEATAYEPPAVTQTTIDMQGHALYSWEDGTRDMLSADGTGSLSIIQAIGDIASYGGEDVGDEWLASALDADGNPATGAHVIYKLDEPQTVELGSIEMPDAPAPTANVWVVSDIQADVRASVLSGTQPEGYQTGFVWSAYSFTREVDVSNDGDVETYCRVVMTANGAVTNPKVMHGEKFVRIVDSMEEGDVIEIDLVSRPPTVTKNGESIIHKTDRASSFSGMAFDVGTSTIQYDADDGSANLSVAVYYNKRYLGV